MARKEDGVLGSLHKYLYFKWRMARLTFLSTFYNSHINSDYVFDTLMQPAFWFIDHFTSAIGPIFVVMVIFLTATAIFIAFWVGLPYYQEHKPPWLVNILLLVGHYLLINVCFHFLMALTIHPGKPPSGDEVLPEVVSVCKKCISPKPPRTHHCSVCNCCILKMDHHCPWLNNCVGHHNHRHFFLYMLFMVVGCAFLMTFGFEIAYQEFIDKWGLERSKEEDMEGGIFVFSRRSLIFFETFITSGCFFCLGALTIWHARLIHAGQTSIEAHINRAETRRLAELGRKYVNPYNFGPWYNWYLFLGLTDGRGWTRVLLPSWHSTHKDGLTWDSVYACSINWTYGEDLTVNKNS